MILNEFILFFKHHKRIALENLLNYRRFRKWVSKNSCTPKREKGIKKIIFLAKDLKGAVNMRGFQPCEALRKKRIKSQVCIEKLPEDIENSMIIFIKYFPFKEVIKAVEKKCVLVYDIVDDFKPFLLKNEGDICDVIIFPNKKMMKDFEKMLSKKTISTVIHHHWDPRFKKVKNGEKFSLAYFGNIPKKNALYYNKIKGLVWVPKFDDQLKTAANFNCLYSIRTENSHNFLYKPNTKVVTAAAIGANIITSREFSAMEFLGEDYPYLTDTDFDSVKKTVDYAKKTFGTKIWFNGLKQMENVRKKTDINVIINDYIRIIKYFKYIAEDYEI